MASRNENTDDDFFGTPLSSALNMPFNLEVGDIVLGRVSHIDEEFVYVSTGFKSEGRIPRTEFVRNPEDKLDLKVDDEIEVMVDRIAAEEIFLSYEKVLEQRRWDELVKKHETQEPIEATVLKAVKGGFRLDIGLSRHAFLPASHAGDAMSATDIEGKTISAMVLEINKETGNVVVSQRELMKREHAEKEDEFYGNIRTGDIVEGKITRLTNFGAFADIGGVEGLIHISEIAWTRVGHPSQLLACGDVVSVKILDTDMEKKKISLSLKQAQGDPWDTIEDRFKPEEITEGTVTRVVNYGAFVKIGDYYEGLLHNAEMQAAGEGAKRLNAGDVLQVKILNIDKKGRRIKLGPAVTIDDPATQPEMERYMDTGTSTSKVTIGDVLDGALDDKTPQE